MCMVMDTINHKLSPDVGHRVADQLERRNKEMLAKIWFGEKVYCDVTQVQIAQPVPVASTLSKLLNSEENSFEQLYLSHKHTHKKEIILFYPFTLFYFVNYLLPLFLFAVIS